DAAGKETLDQPITQALRRQPAIAAQRDRFFPRAMQQGGVAAPEIDHKVVVEIVCDDAADIVLAENLAIHLRLLPPARMRCPFPIGPDIIVSLCERVRQCKLYPNDR